METDRPVAGRSGTGLFSYGQSMLAFAGLAVTVIFLAATAGTLWQAVHARRGLAEQADTERIRTAGELLAETAEALLSADEVSTLRRIISEAGIGHDLDLCRIVLPNGQVVADATPTHITIRKLPDAWGGSPGAEKETFDGRILTLRYPIEVPGRGAARLEIAATIARPTGTSLEAQTGQVTIAGLALVAILLVCRHAGFRLRAVGAIRQALLAMKGGEKDPSVLQVSPDFGAEADAWNMLLAENEDLKKRVVLREARQSFQSTSGASGEVGAACDAMPQGLVLVDADTCVKYANGAAATLLQTTRDELLGANLSGLVKDERIPEAVHSAAAGPTYKRTIVEVALEESAAGGVLRFVIRPVRQEDSGVAMVVIEDITQQRVAEEARNAFLARATHELRTPLTNIRLYVETALEEGRDKPATMAKCLNVINTESRRLERVVSDILSVSEIEAGSFKISMDDIRFESLLEQLEADYEPQAKEKKIKLAFDLPPKVPVLRGDRDKIAIALHNLIGNALKYTPEGGTVTVSVAVDQQQLLFEVADTGIGISETDAERIFEKFYRANDPRVAEVTGSGMGLALAREIVRMHGGNISVQSMPNRGSTFTLTMPIPEEASVT